MPSLSSTKFCKQFKDFSSCIKHCDLFHNEFDNTRKCISHFNNKIEQYDSYMEAEKERQNIWDRNLMIFGCIILLICVIFIFNHIKTKIYHLFICLYQKINFVKRNKLTRLIKNIGKFELVNNIINKGIQECSICLEEPNKTDVWWITLKCHHLHTFHIDCITGWINKQGSVKKCPYCNAILNAKN